MDEMKIASEFARRLVSKTVSAVLRTRYGYSADIQLNEFNAVVTDGDARIHLNIDANIPQTELARLLAYVGLG